MTASAALCRPVLYLVPAAGSRRPERPPGPRTGGRVALSALAAEVAARVLGTAFGPVAARVARDVTRRVPLPVRRARPEVWAAAIAFLLAEESCLYDYDVRVTRTSLARELGCSLPTLRRRATEIRTALDPLELVIPALDDA